MNKIILEGMEFYAYHGVLKEENKIGAKYIVDIELYVDLSGAAMHDKLDETVDYTEVYNIIKAEMNIASRLIEHAGGRIVTQLLFKIQKIEGVNLKLTKINPPTGGKLKSAAVVLEKWRNK